MRFLVAVVGSALNGALLGIGLFAIYALRGAPGSTGMEILVLPLLIVEATVAGTAAAVVSLFLPRTRLAWSDNFVLLTLAAATLQMLVSLAPFLIYRGYIWHDMRLWAVLMSGPVDWTKGGLNWGWLYTLPLTLGICSPWFRSRFGG